MGCCCCKKRGTINSPHNSKIFVAIFNYEARFDSDISFRKGDEMKISDDKGCDWWKVFHMPSSRSGMIPRKYVVEKGSLEAEEWFFPNCSRQQAECLILDEKNSVGSFLVRKSETCPNSLSLTVKDHVNFENYRVKHFKIHFDKKRYYINENHRQESLQQLILDYKDAQVICNATLKPCPKPLPTLWVLNPKLREIEVDRKEIKRKHILNQGYFGEVYYGTWAGHAVAIKSMKPGKMSTQAFLKEAEIMREFRHDKLVALYAVCSKSEPIWIIQEYMSNGSLLDYLRKSRVFFSIDELVYLATQIAEGMAYLESKKLVHSDLAARNVLIGENKVAKISDFGLARILTGNYDENRGMKLAIRWTAPEVLNKGIVYSTKSDVWSYAIVLMEIFTYGETPYGGLSDNQIIQKLNQNWRLPKPNPQYTVPDSIYNLMLECWHKDPNKRPTFSYLFKHFEDYTTSTEKQYNSLKPSK